MVAGSILTAIYHMIRDDEPYRPPVRKPLDAPAKKKRAARLAAEIRELGFTIQVSPAA